MLFRKTLNSWQLFAHRSEGNSCPALGRRLMEKAGEVRVATQGGLWEQPCCPRCRWLRLPESSCRHLTPSPAAKNEKHIPAVGAARTGSGQSALLCLLVEGTVSRARGLELGLAGALAPCLGSKRLPALGVGLGGGPCSDQEVRRGCRWSYRARPRGAPLLRGQSEPSAHARRVLINTPVSHSHSGSPEARRFKCRFTLSSSCVALNRMQFQCSKPTLTPCGHMGACEHPSPRLPRPAAGLAPAASLPLSRAAARRGHAEPHSPESRAFTLVFFFFFFF